MIFGNNTASDISKLSKIPQAAKRRVVFGKFWNITIILFIIEAEKCSVMHKRPDKIPPWFLKEYAHEIGPVLTLIYEASIDSGVVPSRWKYANVCRVFKGGQKSNPCNCRPISLTCIACKVLEHSVHSYVMKHLDFHQILSSDTYWCTTSL